MNLLNQTLSDQLAERRIQNGDRPAYCFDDVWYTWREVDILSDRLALTLLDQGIQKGTHIGLWGVNTLGWALHFFAALKLGAVPVLINASYLHDEMAYLLNYADVTYLAIGEPKPRDGLDYRAMFAGLQAAVPKLQGHQYLDEALAAAQAAPPLTSEEEARLTAVKGMVTCHDTAGLAFTSGTTSHPKGVLLSFYNILNNAAAIVEAMHWTIEDRMLLSTPFFHCSGSTAGLLLGIQIGMPSVILRCYDSLQIMQAIQTYRCTAFNVVPSMLLMLMQRSDFSQFDLSSFKSGVMAGSGLGPKEYIRICNIFGLDHLQIAYGQTETSPLVTFSDYDDTLERKSDTVGKVLPNIRLRIWSMERNCLADVGEAGEIQIQGYCVMQGYYKLPEANANKFTEDGWLRTGDLGFLDQDDYCHFCERAGNIIIRGGENISPRELEDCILTFPGIREARVLGVKAEIVQEKVIAFVIPTAEDFDTEALLSYLRQKVARYKVPEHIFLLDAFPMTASGKADQAALKALASKKLNL